MSKKRKYKWLLKGKVVTQVSELDPNTNYVVYTIYYTDGTRYIGKYQVRSILTKPAPKNLIEGVEYFNKHVMRDNDGNIITSAVGRKKARTGGTKAKKEKYYSMMNVREFISYKGSRDYSEDPVDRQVDYIDIIYQCSHKKAATYLEADLQFKEQVLFSDKYLNSNILGSFYDDTLNGHLS